MEIWARCDTLEECYEFMLAYAAQGLSSDQGRQAGDEVRGYLHRALKATAGLAESCAMALKEKGLQPDARYHALLTDLFLVSEILKPKAVPAKLVNTG
jgi:hypothetical protein